VVEPPRRFAPCAIIGSEVRRHTPEEIVAKSVPEDRRDPAWPELPDGEHPVTELTADVQGNLSPFGDLEFPLERVPYVHPVTEVNR
jgi:hypothetical protein